ncbi:MAG TPA: pirin-like C-terminal cupin domain-containing protein, partial [Polyangia bacterium]
ALPDDHDERAVYVAAGSVRIDGRAFVAGQMVVLARGAHVTVGADGDAHALLLGGAPLDGERHIYWNFVASTKERIEAAKRDWRQGRFPKVPGDELELIPLPE